MDLVGLYLAVETEAADGTRTRVWEQRHDPYCRVCHAHFDEGGMIAAILSVNITAGREDIGFTCQRHTEPEG